MPLSGVFQACECAAARMAALRDFGKAPSRCTRRKSFHGQPAAVEIRRNFESPESWARIFHTHFVAQASKPAVLPTSKSAGFGCGVSRFGNPRYSRLGSLRYPVKLTRVVKYPA